MTQMMLFDTCTLAPNVSMAPNVAVAPNPAPVATSPVATSPLTANPSVSRPRAARTAVADSAPADDGLHRMGDLARLVLLRYQLVAQRRQQMAARRGK